MGGNGFLDDMCGKRRPRSFLREMAAEWRPQKKSRAVGDRTGFFLRFL
jgi:hypothetical protein